jgi:hypothetical protein
MPQPPSALAHRFSSCRSLFCDCVVTSCGHRYCAGCVQGARDCPACGADIESLEPDEETQGAQEAGSSCGLQHSIPSIWIAPGDAVVGNRRRLPQRPEPCAPSRLAIALPKCCRVCYEASATTPAFVLQPWWSGTSMPTPAATRCGSWRGPSAAPSRWGTSQLHRYMFQACSGRRYSATCCRLGRHCHRRPHPLGDRRLSVVRVVAAVITGPEFAAPPSPTPLVPAAACSPSCVTLQQVDGMAGERGRTSFLLQLGLRAIAAGNIGA